MTVKQLVNNSQRPNDSDQINKFTTSINSQLDRCFCEKTKLKIDRESSGSSEDGMEYSPRSVAKFGRWMDHHKKKIDQYVHSQILKIREEDSHLGLDIGEGLSCGKDQLVSQMDVLIFSRPASPLSGRTSIRSTTMH